MTMFIGYGTVALFFAAVIVVLERSKRQSANFTDYAVAGRAFGSWYQTMSFLNTWLPGTIFISFAGLAAGSGVLGFYYLPYSLLAVVLMFFMAQRVHDWGRGFDLRTQAEFLGMRYHSRVVRIVAALIGVVSSLPWMILGMQSLGLVFSYLSFGRISAVTAVIIGVVVLAARQVWTVRMGMRGVVISDMVQGIVAYGLGLSVILGLLVWLLTNGHGLGRVPDAYFTIPGPGSVPGPLYLASIVLTGTLGGWCWPDIFVRRFTARSTRVIKSSAVRAAPILFLFGSTLTLVAILASSVPGVAQAPDDVWFITAGVGGVGLVTAAGVIVLAATMGNVDANIQAVGAQLTQDVLAVKDNDGTARTHVAKLCVTVLTLLAAVGAMLTAGGATGLVRLALLSYQGIVQLAPTLLLGIFWKRGNAIGAAAAMLTGFATAAALEWNYPLSVPWLGGLTSGVAGLAANTVVYLAFAYAKPHSSGEQARLTALFGGVATGGGSDPAEGHSHPATAV
jgi:solute:Na+ symporter, SSS family